MSSSEEAITAGVEQRHAWRIAGISMIVLIFLVFMLFHQTFVYLSGLWNQYDTGNYAHGYLVLAISVYLVVSGRKQLAELTPCPCFLAIPAVLLASLLWLIAVLVDVYMIQTVALLLLMLALVWAVLGNRVTGKLMFPILFIGFAIPVWFPLSPLLQDLTADVVFFVIRSIGVPAVRQENIILLPAGTFSVEEACSGLRYLLAALTLGALYAYLNYQTLRSRLLVVLVAAIAGILANMVRVFIVVYLGYKTDMQHPYVNDHLMLGWYLFGALVILLLIIDARLQRHFQRQRSSVKAGGSGAQQQNTPSEPCAKGRLKYTAAVFASAVMLSAGPTAAYMVSIQAGERTEDLEIDLPESIGHWTQVDIQDDWMPLYQGAGSRKQIYRKYDDTVILYAGCYTAQQQGKELINDLNRISNETIWKTGYPRARVLNKGEHAVLEQLLESNRGEKRLVWYWYRVAERITISDYEAKLLQVLGLITGKNQACITAISTDLEPERAITRNRLAEFAFESGPIEIGVND